MSRTGIPGLCPTPQSRCSPWDPEEQEEGFSRWDVPVLLSSAAWREPELPFPNPGLSEHGTCSSPAAKSPQRAESRVWRAPGCQKSLGSGWSPEELRAARLPWVRLSSSCCARDSSRPLQGGLTKKGAGVIGVICRLGASVGGTPPIRSAAPLPTSSKEDQG